MHLTESCDEDSPRLITHVETSRAGNGDVDVTPVIHQAVKEKELLPKEHLTDTNYAEAKQFGRTRQQYGIDLIAPTRADHKWQAKEQQGFDGSHFPIDWDAQKATCPSGWESSSWTPAIDHYDNQVIKIKFSRDRLQAMSAEANTVLKLPAERSPCASRNTIKPYKKSGYVKRGPSSGRNIEPDQA